MWLCEAPAAAVGSYYSEGSSQNPAFIADTIKNCISIAGAMSYWTFSNVFEEGGVPSGLFNNTFGMMNQLGDRAAFAARKSFGRRT